MKGGDDYDGDVAGDAGGLCFIKESTLLFGSLCFHIGKSTLRYGFLGFHIGKSTLRFGFLSIPIRILRKTCKS